MGGKYKKRGRTKEQSNALRKASWTEEKKQRVTMANKKRAAIRAAAFVMPIAKKCNICEIEKPISGFSFHKTAKDGHLNNCKPCEVLRVAAWTAKNSEKAKKWRAVNQRTLNENHYKKNQKELLLKAKKRRSENREIYKERDRLQAKNNPARVRAKCGRRRAAKNQSTPSWLSAIQNAQIAEFYEFATAREMQTGNKYHVDHIIPLQGKCVRGLHVPWNLQVLTEFENCSKHNRLIEQRSA